MKVRIVHRKEVIQNYILCLPKRHYIAIYMNSNKEIQRHLKINFGLDLTLDRINLVESNSEQESIKIWNAVCMLKGIPTYLFNNGSLVSSNES